MLAYQRRVVNTACVGCGLRLNGVTGDLEVASAEEFGSGALSGFGGDDTVGAPTYCDGNGQIRTVPEHTSSIGEDTGSAGSTGVASATTTYAAQATLVLNNPSAIRAASVLVCWAAARGVTVGVVDAQWTDLFVATRNALALFTLNNTQSPRNAAQPAVFGSNPATQTVDTIAAGGSVTYVLDIGVTTAGGTTLDFTSSASIRALAVTQ